MVESFNSYLLQRLKHHSSISILVYIYRYRRPALSLWSHTPASTDNARTLTLSHDGDPTSQGRFGAISANCPRL